MLRNIIFKKEEAKSQYSKENVSFLGTDLEKP
jgi:hypothetical protein